MGEHNTVKPLIRPLKNFKQPLKIDKTKILMTNGSLMKVNSIAECCNTFGPR